MFTAMQPGWAQPDQKPALPAPGERQHRSMALRVVLMVALLLAPLNAVAQLSDDARTSTQGTQFVKPPPQAAPPPAQPPAKQAEPPPAKAAVQRPATPPASPPDPPRYPSVVFLVDTSDSMLNYVVGGKRTRLDEAKRALIHVLERMGPETRVQVWTFNKQMAPILVDRVPSGRFITIGRRNHREALIAKVNRFRTAGGTNLYRSVVKALDFFARPRDQALYRSGRRFPVLVVVSDGEDGGKTRETLDTVQQAKKNHPLVTVNTIGFRISRQQRWLTVLCRIATEEKGCATADDEPQLRRMLDSFYRPRR